MRLVVAGIDLIAVVIERHDLSLVLSASCWALGQDSGPCPVAACVPARDYPPAAAAGRAKTSAPTSDPCWAGSARLRPALAEVSPARPRANAATFDDVGLSC